MWLNNQTYKQHNEVPLSLKRKKIIKKVDTIKYLPFNFTYV